MQSAAEKICEEYSKKEVKVEIKNGKKVVTARTNCDNCPLAKCIRRKNGRK